MSHHSGYWLFLCILICFSGVSSNSHAEALASDQPAPETKIHLGPFTQGQASIQVTSGVMFSPVLYNTWRTDLDYFQTNLRLGLMLNEPTRKGSVLDGNFEALFELSNSVIYNGPGNYMGGITVFLRYNFIQPDRRLVPYAQFGAGIIYNDVHEDNSQGLMGQAIEFSLQGGLGMHYFVRENWTLDVEAMYQHYSNADLANRNMGVDAFGGFIGVTHYFGRL